MHRIAERERSGTRGRAAAQPTPGPHHRQPPNSYNLLQIVQTLTIYVIDSMSTAVSLLRRCWFREPWSRGPPPRPWPPPGLPGPGGRTCPAAHRSDTPRSGPRTGVWTESRTPGFVGVWTESRTPTATSGPKAGRRLRCGRDRGRAALKTSPLGVLSSRSPVLSSTAISSPAKNVISGITAMMRVARMSICVMGTCSNFRA